eukprot:COSAG06_NODE_683_length_13114_cov_7.121322_5_plen_86_part_00
MRVRCGVEWNDGKRVQSSSSSRRREEKRREEKGREEKRREEKRRVTLTRAETAVLSHFYIQTMLFAKTGSGQTHETAEKREEKRR